MYFKKIVVKTISAEELKRFEAYASSNLYCRNQKISCNPIDCKTFVCKGVECSKVG